MVQRLHDDFDTMHGILAPLDAQDWTGMMVTHAYVGPPSILLRGGPVDRLWSAYLGPA